MSKKINTDWFLKVSTGKNLYALDTTKFKANVLHESTGTITEITNAFSEVINPVVAASTTTTSSIEGVTTIPVTDGSVFDDGDVIKIDAERYYIESISGNNLTILKPCSLHSSGATVERVGNTGIYKVLVNLATAGDYTAFINNPQINMQNHSTSITISDVSDGDITTQLAAINDELVRSSFI